MLNGEDYPYFNIIEKIKFGYYKQKPDPCSKCVIDLICKRYSEDEYEREFSICKDKIDYDNYIEVIKHPIGYFELALLGRRRIHLKYSCGLNPYYYESNAANFVNPYENSTYPGDEYAGYRRFLLKKFTIFIEKNESMDELLKK